MRPFLEVIRDRVLVCDGAMGTMLYAKGVFLNRSFDELNLTQPDMVAEVHQAYVRAGADVLETNTFGANRIKLGVFGLADRLHAVNVQGVRIARHAAREHTYVAGAIGPLGVRVEPWGKTGVDEAEDYFREQASALVDGGVDLFILETFRDLNEVGAAIRAVRSVCSLPIVAQMTTEEDGNTLDGTPPEVFAPAVGRLGADMIGLNCSVGPAAMLETIERVARVTNLGLSAQPNAGKPRDMDGRNIYLSSPEYMASYARRFVLRGVRLIGGCCGTTPEHIRHIRDAVRAVTPPAQIMSMPLSGTTEPPAPVTPVAVVRPQKSRMAESLSRGSFVVAVELWPPRGYRSDELIEQALALKVRGVDIADIPDGPRAGPRMSALSAAVLVERQAGIETVLHFSCRDRTLLSMQSDLLGAHAMGLRNLLLTTGEPLKIGGYPDATGVFDIDSIGLTNVVSRLNKGLDVGGQPIGGATAFHIGVAVNPSAVNIDEEIRRFEYKLEAGAEFAVTQPIFDLRLFERFLKRVESARIPVIAGLLPLQSLRHAEFLANEIPGLLVPEEIIERMRRAETPEAASAEGIAIARELASAVRQLVQGVQISTRSADVETALAVLAP